MRSIHKHFFCLACFNMLAICKLCVLKLIYLKVSFLSITKHAYWSEISSPFIALSFLSFLLHPYFYSYGSLKVKNKNPSLMLQDTRHWPLIAPLPSYGRGRERPGGRYISFIHGDRLHDIIITG